MTSIMNFVYTHRKLYDLQVVVPDLCVRVCELKKNRTHDSGEISSVGQRSFRKKNNSQWLQTPKMI